MCGGVEEERIGSDTGFGGEALGAFSIDLEGSPKQVSKCVSESKLASPSSLSSTFLGSSHFEAAPEAVFQTDLADFFPQKLSIRDIVILKLM